MEEKLFRTVEDYMKNQGIEIVEFISFDKKSFNNINESHIESQLYLISEFHGKMKNCDKCILQRIENQTGKIVEQHKVELNKCRRILDNIKKMGYKNNFENMLIECGEDFINLGEKCIQEIYNSGYIDIIVRSMDNSEVCLGDTYFDNLVCEQGNIHIKNINKISYNMVEMDAFSLLNKLYRKKVIAHWEDLIDKFCYFEHLDDRSKKLIIALMKYPYDFVKYCNKYKKNKKYDDKKCEEKLKNLIINSKNII